MKKLLLPLLSVCILSANAQTVFWSEDFGTGCNQGNAASGYSGSNGAWAITSTGTNDPSSNKWFVSATEAFTGSNNCGDGCLNNPALTDATLHVGNESVAMIGMPADNGATYNTGGLCQAFSICVITNTRAESPVINCSGKSNIMLGFSYMEGGDATDDGSVWYYDGATWSLLANTQKTAATCSPQGTWTPFTVSLPSSANNNPNVKIGFNWTNNDDATGTDPSFAVDSIRLSSTVATSIALHNAAELSIINDGTDIVIMCDQPYKVLNLRDMLGRNVNYVQSGNRIAVSQSKGIYFVEAEMNSVRLVKKVVAGQ
jgi:hypothetical protein